MNTTLAGATYRQDVLTKAFKRNSGQNIEVRLNRELDNPHDPNAIAVHDLVDDALLGYIPRQAHAHWMPRLDALNESDSQLSCFIDYWKAKDLYLAKLIVND